MDEKTEEYVRKLVDEAPPLTPYQRDLLATLLRPVVVERVPDERQR